MVARTVRRESSLMCVNESLSSSLGTDREDIVATAAARTYFKIPVPSTSYKEIADASARSGPNNRPNFCLYSVASERAHCMTLRLHQTSYRPTIL